jgi:gliding motility-associated-like protein
MKFRFILILLILGTASVNYAQLPETVYQGTIVYEGYYDDRSWGPLPLGFNFKFYGHPYNRFYVSTNGLITFGSGTNDYTEDPIPSPALPNNFIAAFWDDVVITPSGKILYTTIGASPNRKCIIQWTNMGFYSSTVLMGTFTVIIYEATEEIKIQYRSIIDHTSARSHGSSASIGIENSNGTSGISYSYHNPDAISSEQAVLFTPTGNGYTMNTSAIYEGVYLTKDFTLPEPGIPKLISPANNSVTNTSQTFEWTGSSNAAYYTLKVSQNSDISASFDHNTGTSTSHDVSDLVLNSTYYWAVFATNSTGTTWSEIYKFTTSPNPPLTAVPLTIWLDQNEERTIRLQSNGGDESPRHATITSLPSQGSLYQYNEGVRGERITSVPCMVTNKDMNLIYLADAQPGNGVGSFSFIITDDTGNSPAGTITVNVNPPGIPNFLLAAKSGNIEIRFDKPMMDPTGKENQFRVTSNGDQIQISGVSLTPGDPYTILVTLQTPLQGGETVYISYTQGDVAAETGGLLPSFTDQLVSFIIQTISFPALPVVTYGDPPITLSASSSSGLPVVFASSNTTVALVTGNRLSFNSAGTAEIMALQSGNGTYAPARYIRTITVNKADQTITFQDPGPKTFGDPDFSLSAVSTSLLPVSFTSSDPSVATISGNVVHITGAGVAILSASQSGNNLYYPAIDVTWTLRVEKANQEITLDSLPDLTYGDNDVVLEAFASSGLAVAFSSADKNIAEVSGTILKIKGAGSTVITASQPGDLNFNAAPEITIPLVISKADQEITFSGPAQVVYGSPDISINASSTSGLDLTFHTSDPSVATINGDKIIITGAGRAMITASQEGNENFNPAVDKSVLLNVEKATLTVTAADKSKIYLSPNPELTIIYTGFVNGDDISVIDNQPIATTEATVNSAAGEYEIIVSGGLDHNYKFIYDYGILEILKAGQEVEFIKYPERMLINEIFPLEATASSGLPVYFESRNPDIAEINGNLLKGSDKGNAVIRAFQPGNENYESGESVISVEVFSTHRGILNLFTPNGDGFNDLWEIPDPESFGQCEVRIFNRWGMLVFAAKDYKSDWDGRSDGSDVPEGAYYYIIKSEKKGTITGTLNLIR